MVDPQRFSCDGCAAAPRLQTELGCFDEAPGILAVTPDGLELRRCPVALRSARAQELYEMASDKYLAAFNGREVRALPAKRVEALRYLEHLIALRAAERREEANRG